MDAKCVHSRIVAISIMHRVIHSINSESHNYESH